MYCILIGFEIKVQYIFLGNGRIIGGEKATSLAFQLALIVRLGMSQLVESTMRVFDIPVEQIFCDDDFNCRGTISPIDVVDLARSIEDNGLQQPITVQPWDKHPKFKYRIVSGHRRFNAMMKVLKRPTVPAILKEGLNELTARQLNLEENLKRKDLNLLQEARALTPFFKAGWTQEEMANRFKQSRGWVQARVALLELPEDIQQEAAAGFLTQEHIKQLKPIAKNRPALEEAVKKIKNAKILGEKKKIRATPKKQNPFQKRKRERDEIFDMMEMMMDVIGPGFYSRCMSWTAGEISDFDLLRDFKEEAGKHGKSFAIPEEMMKKLVGG